MNENNTKNQQVVKITKRKDKHMKIEIEEYMDIEKRKEVRDSARKLRRQYLRYKEAEIVYSIQHKKLLELASNAGALVRIDGYVLIDRDIFDAYLDQFREPSTLLAKEGKKK